jgi:hypothetical protein
MFKQLRQLRETTAALPGVIAGAQALKTAAETYQQQAVTTAGPVQLSTDDPRLVPVSGIDLTTYARTVKTAVSAGRPAVEVAAELGVTPDEWADVVAGWSQRMQGDMALAVEYGTIYSSVV